MELLPSGLTWSAIVEQFAATNEFTLILEQKNRRTSKRLRAQGETEERKVWRLTVQKEHKNFQRTSFRKNVRTDVDGLLSEVANEKLVTKINNALAQNI